MKKNVLITGGTGFIGKKMTSLLIERGFSVAILSRSKRENKTDISYYVWDIDKMIMDENAVLNADYIIHLAGEGIADKRWTSKRKRDIINSREKPIQLIFDVLKKNNKKLDAFVSASAVGIYGAFTSETICTENTPVANDFLGSTCQKWEAEADRIGYFGIRIVKIRTGLVLGKEGGFLKRLMPVFKWRLGAALGSGKQYTPWIHIDDLCGIYLEALTNTAMDGAYNAAINDNITNIIFSKTLAKVLGYSIWLPNVPAFILKIVLGEMSKIILTGQRVSSDKIESTGFKFKYKVLENALKDCL